MVGGRDSERAVGRREANRDDRSYWMITTFDAIFVRHISMPSIACSSATRWLIMLRQLDESEGFPPLPTAEVVLQSADRDLPRAAVRLHDFLIDALRPDQ